VAELLEQPPPSGGWLPPEFEPGLVSVIIPVYNGGEFIGETLGSILAQTYEKVEVVVADDGSTDRTPEVVRRVARALPCRARLDLRVLRQPNRGQNPRATSAPGCRGEYLNFFEQRRPDGR